jgi:hypothetical protein
MHMPTLGQPGKGPNSSSRSSSRSSSSARAGGPTRGERREGGSGDWDSAWYKKSLTEVAEPASFENKVDQLWQSILTKLFPSRRTPEGVEGGLGGGNCSLGYIVIVEGIGVVDSGISVAKSGFSLAEDESTWLSVRKRATLERKGRVVVWMGSKEDYWMLERWEIYSN